MNRTVRLNAQEIGEAIREWVERHEGEAPDRVTLAFDPGDPPFGSGFYYAIADMPERKPKSPPRPTNPNPSTGSKIA